MAVLAESAVQSFARQAAALLMRGEAPAALQVCKEGVALHPAYLTGVFMLGRCHEALGQYAEATAELRRAARKVPRNASVQRVLRRIEAAEREEFEAFTARRRQTLSVEADSQSFEAYAAAHQPAAESAVDFLLRQVEQVKRTVSPEPPSREPSERESARGNGKIVTPTLAEIYASQGEYGEAMKAYRKLMTLRAADAPQFEKRLAELEALARSRGNS
jgi:tetratricopeptide (TPR) repeat protein